MEILATLLAITVPVFLIIAAGYAAVRTGYMPDGVVDALVRFSVTAAVPCLLFLAMYRVDLATAIDTYTLIAFFTGGTVTFFATMAVSRLVWKRRPGEAVAVGFCAFFPNAVMLGIPITERSFGAETLAALFGVIAFHSIYNYFLGFVTMEAVRRDSETILAGLRKAFVTSFSHPLMIGLLAGIAANLVSLPLPGVVEDGLDMMASAALPVALFSIGGVLTRYRLRDEIGEATMVSVFTLLIHPLIAWVLTAQVFGLEDHFVRAAVTVSAMPAGINSYIFATMYNRAVGTAANAVLLSTILSVATITFWLAFLGAG